MKSNKSWRRPLITGMLIPVVGVLLYNKFKPEDVSDPYVKAAKHLGVTPTEFRSIMLVHGKAEKGGDISPADWNRLRTYRDGSNVKMKQLAISVLGFLKQSSYKTEALTYLRNEMNDSDRGSAAVALMAYARLGAADYKDVCTQKLNDLNPQVRMVAQQCVAGRYTRRK